MSDAIDGLIEERRAMDRGLKSGLVASIAGHLVLIGAVATASWWSPKTQIRVVEGTFVPMPPGGGGPSKVDPAPAPPATVAKAPEPPVTEPPAPEPPPKITKPPKDEPAPNRIPELDAKVKPKKDKSPPPVRTASVTPPGPKDKSAKPAPGAPGGTGKQTNSQFPGLDMIAPVGPGVPGGTDMSGDWYLAGVQRKIWLVWNQQVKSGWTQPIGVSFTILADGSVTDVQVVQPSGITMLDFAARRAVMAAGPFSPLPRDYGTTRFTLQALFKPTS